MYEVITGGGGGSVAMAATALAELLHARVRPLRVPAPAADALLAELDSPLALACVLDCSPDPDAACWSVAASADKPVVLVPPAARTIRPHIGRVLLPLDGTPESSEAVRDVAALLDHAGADLLVLHVFDTATIPKFWDQLGHAQRAWTEEFLLRTGAPSGTRMELRSGVPAEHVMDVAAHENVDLIALGWSRRIAGGRARTVRESVLHATVPVLLLPVYAERASKRQAVT